MRGSAVVQGLKSWVSKLHPQLPLDRRESQRLLTALTDSFRQHLDQVHPHQAGEDGGRSPPTGSASQAAVAEKFHSSATTADRLMSSVLTSPLLAKRPSQPSKADRDYSNMRVDLESSGKDPITLLEEYHARGAATLPIATLCLQHFSKSMSELSEDAKLKRIQEHQPGRRTLLWLWRSDLYATSAFTESRTLISSLARFMIMEDLEQYLWDWLKLDVGSVVGLPEGKGRIKTLLYKYRWKGHMLRAMVDTKLQGHFTDGHSADAALDTFFRASDVHFPSADVSTHSAPSGPVGSLLHRELISNPTRYANTSAEHYDRFIDLVGRWSTSSIAELNQATLRLWHPHNPTGLPAYRLLMRLYGPLSEAHSSADKMLKRRLDNPKDDTLRVWFFKMSSAIACALENEGYHEEGKWMDSMIKLRYPDVVREMPRDQSEQTLARALSQDEHVTDKVLSTRPPFPAFAEPLRS